MVPDGEQYMAQNSFFPSRPDLMPQIYADKMTTSLR